MTRRKALLPKRFIGPQIEYRERENLKRAAWEALRKLPHDAFKDRVRNALIIIAMWYQRNRDQCPDFPTYVAHLNAAATAHGGFYQRCFGDDVGAWLIESCGLADPYYISPGYSDFGKIRRHRRVLSTQDAVHL